MGAQPLIIPFQTEVFVTNNKNTPDKSCVKIAPDYEKVEYTSFLGTKISPPPFTYHSPLHAGIHLHFILPACFRRAVQQEENGGYSWEYAAVPDRFIVTRLILGKGGIVSKYFIVESNYMGLDNSDSTAVPFLSDSENSHRYLGRRFEYGNARKGDGEYLDKLTAMGAGDPYFSAYYPSCYSVFGFYDNMADVESGSDVSYFVTGYFSNKQNDPFYSVQKEEFQERLNGLGLMTSDSQFYTDECVLFSEVWGIRWEGYSADYPSGRPTKEISCGLGNTSAEIISAVIGQTKVKRTEKDWEVLFDALQYEVADTLEDMDGIALAEDEIHAQTFASGDGGNIWTLRYQEGRPKDLPKQTGFLLAGLNDAQRAYNRKLEEISFWQDAAYADWYAYMLRYEGVDSPSPQREKMKREIFRVCKETLPKLKREAEQLKRSAEEQLAQLKTRLEGIGIDLEQTGDVKYSEPKEPVLMLYGEGVERSYAFVDEGNVLCQTRPVKELSDGTVTLKMQDLLKYAGNIPEIIQGFQEFFIQAMCLNDQIVKLIGVQEGLPALACDKCGIFEFAGRKFEQSWLTLLIEWKVSFYPSRTLSAAVDDSMKVWKFDGMDYENENPNREEMVMYAGRNMITPHSLYQFRYVAEKYMAEKGEISEELKEALRRVEKLPVLSQSLDGLNQQFLSRMQILQVPVIGNESDTELTDTILAAVPAEKRAVNQTNPFFPLRAGHIHLEKVNIVNSFGMVQNAFAEGMNPVYSAVMGEYEHPNKSIKFGQIRPRIQQGARLRFDFVTAEDEEVLAEATPETTPVCGIMLPELLSGRLSLYSAKGEYYGCIKTVYRGERPCAAWLSPPDRIEIPFEEVFFSNKRFQSMIAYLLKDSKEGGTAFADLMALIQEQLECAAPSGTNLGMEFPYIWGRPLAVSLSRVGVECQGGLAFSQSEEDYGLYKTLSVEQIEFPLMAGDRKRAGSGIVGYYEGFDYTKIYPAYHSKKKGDVQYAFDADRDNRNCGKYVRFGENTVLCPEGKKKVLTIISEIGNTLYFQTGILPVVKKTLDAVHTDCVSKIKMCFEADSVMCVPAVPMMPTPAAGSEEEWYFEWIERQSGQLKKHTAKIVGNTDVFHEQKEIVCDGYLTLERSSKEPHQVI